MDMDAFHALSSNQVGTFSRDQLLDLGWTPSAIRNRLDRGQWVRLHTGVYGLAGHGDGWHRKLWAAHLHAGPDSVLSCNSAGRIHGIRQALAGRVELTVTAERGKAPEGVRWFRQRDLDDDDVTTVSGLPPLTTAPRTVVDLAGSMSITVLRSMMKEGHIDRRHTLPAVAVVFERVRRHGKPGVGKIARVLDELGPGDGIPRSKLEELGDEVIEAAHLPEPLHEHPLPNAVGRSGFVDRCWPEAKFIVEFDGRKWHQRDRQALHDADRRMESAAVGYFTQAVLWEHATSGRERTAQILRAIYDDRIALLT